MSFVCDDMFDGNMPSFSAKAERLCRKVKTCDECASEISVGERYREITGIWDGEWYRHHMCGFCAEKWDEMLHETGSLLLGCLWEARELLGEDC